MIFLCLAMSSLLLTLLIVSVKKNFQLINQLEDVSNQVEESLDILDSYYQKIDLKSKTEIWSDEPIVKDLIEDIKGCKNAVLLVANKVYSPLEQNDENDEGSKN